MAIYYLIWKHFWLVKWTGVNLRLLKSIVTFLEISVQVKSKGCLCPVTVPLSKAALLLHSVFLLLYVISEFMNFFLRCHPGGLFATVSLFNVRWNSLLLLRQMTSMFTYSYSMPLTPAVPEQSTSRQHKAYQCSSQWAGTILEGTWKSNVFQKSGCLPTSVYL